MTFSFRSENYRKDDFQENNKTRILHIFTGHYNTFVARLQLIAEDLFM